MQEQEPTVNDILSSIRQILSNKIEDGNDGANVSNVSDKNVVSDIDEKEKNLMQATDVYVLMPDMRVEQDKVTHSSETMSNEIPHMPDTRNNAYERPVSDNMIKGVENGTENKAQTLSVFGEEKTLSDIQETDVKPMIQAWLDTNLPALVERIVTEEVRRIFNKR